jgi:hypothetical protein
MIEPLFVAARNFVASQRGAGATSQKKWAVHEARPKFREETPRRRTAGRRATTDAALHNMRPKKRQIKR